VLAVDWWRFGRTPGLLGGLPDWMAYFAILGIVLAVAFAFLGKALLRRRPSGRSAHRSGARAD
jgi:hypothetical protein